VRRLVIEEIERGTGQRSKYIYAVLRDADTRELLVSATLDYITGKLLNNLELYQESK
jgi:hypothetical protein